MQTGRCGILDIAKWATYFCTAEPQKEGKGNEKGQTDSHFATAIWNSQYSLCSEWQIYGTRDVLL